MTETTLNFERADNAYEVDQIDEEESAVERFGWLLERLDLWLPTLPKWSEFGKPRPALEVWIKPGAATATITLTKIRPGRNNVRAFASLGNATRLSSLDITLTLVIEVAIFGGRIHVRRAKGESKPMVMPEEDTAEARYVIDQAVWQFFKDHAAYDFTLMVETARGDRNEDLRQRAENARQSA